MDLKTLTQAAVKISQIAGRTLLSRSKEVEVICHKTGLRDIVTQTDRLVENQIVEYLKRLTPYAGFIGEELGYIDNDARIVWVIDPIDGTKYFIENIPLFSITIALMEDMIPRICVIHQPVVGKTYYAYKGGGAFMNGVRKTCSQISDVKSSICYLDLDRSNVLSELELQWVISRITRLLSNIYRVRAFGAGAIAACWMAGGGLDAFIDITGYNPIWDSAAVQVLMEEAGAVQAYLDVGVGPPKFVATGPGLWDAYNRILLG